MTQSVFEWPVCAGDTDSHDVLAFNECVAKSWLDPRCFDDIVGVDFGVGKMHYYSTASGRKRSVSIEHAISALVALPARTLILSEDAHLGVAQTHRSLSQPFTERQLLGLYGRIRATNKTLLLFPHAHSGTRAREWVAHHMPNFADSGKTSDINDAVSIALFVKHCNDVSLLKPPVSFARCPLRDFGRAVTKISNITLNAERTRGYKGTMFPDVVSLGKAVRNKCKERAIDLKAAISIASTIITSIDGVPALLVRDGRPLGGRAWLRHVMRFSPFHHRGGIARSNLMRHRFRPYLAKFALNKGVPVKRGSKYIKFAQYDKKQKAVRALAIRSFRAAVLKAYRSGVEIATSRGLKAFDPIKDARGNSHGR